MKKNYCSIVLINIAFQAEAQQREFNCSDTGWRFINHDIALADIDQIDDSSLRPFPCHTIGQ
jgi:hypothetical protein